MVKVNEDGSIDLDQSVYIDDHEKIQDIQGENTRKLTSKEAEESDISHVGIFYHKL